MVKETLEMQKMKNYDTQVHQAILQESRGGQTYAVLTLTDELSLLLVVRLGKLTDLVCTEEATCADCH